MAYNFDRVETAIVREVGVSNSRGVCLFEIANSTPDSTGASNHVRTMEIGEKILEQAMGGH